MKRGATEHPKMIILAKLLNLEPWGAIGIMEMLWHYTAKYAPAGDIGKWPDDLIAAGVGWKGEPSNLVDALVKSRLLDKEETHRLIIHGWDEHSEDQVDLALARSGKSYASGRQPRMTRLSKQDRALLCAQHGFKDFHTTDESVPQKATECHLDTTALPKPCPALPGQALPSLARPSPSSVAQKAPTAACPSGPPLAPSKSIPLPREKIKEFWAMSKKGTSPDGLPPRVQAVVKSIATMADEDARRGAFFARLES